MRLRNLSPFAGRPRSGKTLVLFVLVAPVLLGMMGLIVDAGMLMASYRQTQNAADAAAMAAAMDLFKGASNATALTTAQSFVTNNGMSATLTLNGGATNALNIPPQITTVTQFKNSQYAEVVVSQTVNTLFIQILGINSSQTVTARAVAGFEPVGAGEGVYVLDSTAAPGLQINNSNTRLIVNGDITVNSQGGGVDQYGATVTSPYNSDAVKVSNSLTTPAPIVATTLNVVGGITRVDNVGAYDPAFSANGYYYDVNNTDHPVFARVPIAPDPLTNTSYTLPTPTTSSPGTPVNNRDLGSPSITKNGANGIVSPNTYDPTSNTATLYPGIYTSITIGGGSGNGTVGTVNFQPGIYVLKSGATNPLKISGGTVTGTGVMFYNTGTTYDPTTGAPDNADGSTTPTSNNGIGGGIQLTGGTVTFLPLIDANSPFNGFLFYQRRWNTNGATISGNSNDLNLQGTLYAKWTNFHVSGQGTYQAQFLVGSIIIDGGAVVTINATGKNIGKANLVFLVE